MYLLNVVEGLIREVNIHDHTSTIDAVVLARFSDSLEFDRINVCNNTKVLPATQTRGPIIGFFTASGCTNIHVHDSMINFNTYNNLSEENLFTYGLLLNGCENSIVKNVSHNNNIIIISPINIPEGIFNGFLCFGGEFTNCVIMTDCQANFNSCSTPDLDSEGAAFGGYVNHHFSTEWVIARCQFNDNTISFGTFVGVLIGDTGGSNVVVKECQTLFNTIGNYWAARGVAIEFDGNTLGTIVEDVQFNGNILGRSFAEFDPVFFAFDINISGADCEAVLTFAGTNDVTCKNIQCNDNFIESASIFAGVNILAANAILIDGLQVNNNAINSLVTIPDNSANCCVTGAILESVGIKFMNGQFNNNTITDGGSDRDINSRGIFSGVWVLNEPNNFPNSSYRAAGIEILNFEAINNIMENTPPFTIVSGILMFNGQNTLVDNSYIALNSGGDENSGIYLLTDIVDPEGSFNNVLANCIVSGQTGGGSFSDGIRLDTVSTSKVIDCEVFGCDSAGFSFINLEDSTVTKNYAEGNAIGMDVSDQSADNIFSNNVLLTNADFGILDESSTTNTNAYYQNQAKNNGTSPAVTVSTTATSASALPTTTILVASTAGFSMPGSLLVTTTANGVQTISCTGNTLTSFTGCTGGTGTLPIGANVVESLDTNYSGGILQTVGAPIRYWLLPNAPNTTDNNNAKGEFLDNISISR